MTRLASFLPVVLGFILCCAISLAGLYFAVSSLVKDMGLGFLSSGRSRTWPEVFTIIIGFILPFVIFPTGAWYLFDNFKAIDSRWLPYPFLVTFFGLFPVIIIILAVLGFGLRDAYSKWHPNNGEQRTFYDTGKLREVINWKGGKKNGESLHYCLDGSIFSKGTYENDLLIGEYYDRGGCDGADDGTSGTYSTFEPAGQLIETKKFIGGNLTSWHYKKDGRDVSIQYIFDDKNNENRIVNERVYITETGESVTRSYNRDGTLRYQSKSVNDKVIEEKWY
ncbi:MAG: toxin-antitoxin system YwqK family antitoxin [Blastocatellia bacterium]